MKCAVVPIASATSFLFCCQSETLSARVFNRTRLRPPPLGDWSFLYAPFLCVPASALPQCRVSPLALKALNPQFVADLAEAQLASAGQHLIVAKESSANINNLHRLLFWLDTWPRCLVSSNPPPETASLPPHPSFRTREIPLFTYSFINGGVPPFCPSPHPRW